MKLNQDLQKKLATSIQQIEEYVKDELWQVEERKKNLIIKAQNLIRQFHFEIR
jgi:hypothetical protein